MKTDSIAFSAGTLNRREDLRRTSDALQKTADARFLPLWAFKPLIKDSGGLATLGRTHTLISHATEIVFLGLDGDDAPIFAADISGMPMQEAQLQTDGLVDSSEQRPKDAPDTVFRDLKSAMTELAPQEAELASTARAVLGWHKSHRFCAACGVQSEAAVGGWQRDCGACSTPHFPRTDPVVIMLVTKGNSVLMGRSPHFPTGMYSLLAGFVEPGEPIEAAVRREVMEEANITVGDVSYVASQPWPFPSTLMIGCHAEALSTDIVIDENELEDALWLTKEQCARVMNGADDEILPVRAGTIAHYLLTKWLADQ